MVRPCKKWLHGDPILIQRVLENYITNAVKYTDAGGVLVACRRHGDDFRFEVWDTGRGIKKENINTIFDAFHQLDNPERDRRKGVGLGLSIVDQIAKLLNTPIFVRSRFGKGSVFSIDVPAGEVEQLPQKLDTPKPVNGDLFVDLVVWIVDDDEDILEGLQLLLETWGCVTRTFDSPEQIETFMRKNKETPELLISDLRLRNHRNGIEVIDMVNRRCVRKVPSIIITGDTGPERLQEVSRAGFSLLHKPVTAERMRLRMAELLKSAENISTGS